MIAYCFGKITQASAQCRVCGAKGLVLDLFRITRLDSVIQFFPDATGACGAGTVALGRRRHRLQVLNPSS